MSTNMKKNAYKYDQPLSTLPTTAFAFLVRGRKYKYNETNMKKNANKYDQPLPTLPTTALPFWSEGE